jgi:hypothetical protein
MPGALETRHRAFLFWFYIPSPSVGFKCFFQGYACAAQWLHLPGRDTHDLEESFTPMKETIVHLFLIGFQRAKSRVNATRVQAGISVPVVKKQMLAPCTMGRDQSGARLLRGTLVLLVFLSNFVSAPSASGAEPPNLLEPENGFLDRRAGWREFTEKALAFV